MAYVREQGGQTTYPYSIGQLRKDNPNTSFPSLISDETLASYGVYVVTVADDPTYDQSTHKLERATLPVEVNGGWVLQCNAVPLSAEEISVRRLAGEAKVRDERDSLLAATDWVVVRGAEMASISGASVSVPQEWLDYRQSLRDITAQAGFPFSVVWPTKPA